MRDASLHFPAHEWRVVPVTAHAVRIQLPVKLRVEYADVCCRTNGQGSVGQSEDTGRPASQAVYQFAEIKRVLVDQAQAQRQQGIEARDIPVSRTAKTIKEAAERILARNQNL